MLPKHCYLEYLYTVSLVCNWLLCVHIIINKKCCMKYLKCFLWHFFSVCNLHMWFWALVSSFLLLCSALYSTFDFTQLYDLKSCLFSSLPDKILHLRFLSQGHLRHHWSCCRTKTFHISFSARICMSSPHTSYLCYRSFTLHITFKFFCILSKDAALSFEDILSVVAFSIRRMPDARQSRLNANILCNDNGTLSK